MGFTRIVRSCYHGRIGYRNGGRGVYFDDPDGHVMEIITQPYGDRPEQI